MQTKCTAPASELRTQSTDEPLQSLSIGGATSAAPCRWCGSTNISETGPKGPHWVKLVCGACHRCVGFKKTPGEVRHARRFVLDFGPFKGKTLRELEGDARGLDYLRWLANVRNEAGRMAAVVLQLDWTNGPGGGRK